MTSIGGQALLEGIMMRGPSVTAMAVRDPEGNIVIEESATFVSARAKVFKAPFVRGIFNMYDSLRTGYKYLMRSAEIAGFNIFTRRINSKTVAHNALCFCVVERFAVKRLSKCGFAASGASDKNNLIHQVLVMGQTVNPSVSEA